MKRLIAAVVFAFLVISPSLVYSGTILWGYEQWKSDASGQVLEWQRYNMNFVPNTPKADGNQTATARILNEDKWGKVYYVTGKSSADIIKTYHYLYLNTYDVQGNMKVAVSGEDGSDYYEVTSYVISGNTGNPKVIYNPGPYVFDLSGWAPKTPQNNVVVQLIAEGGSQKGFEVNRVFISDYNPITQGKAPKKR